MSSLHGVCAQSACLSRKSFTISIHRTIASIFRYTQKRYKDTPLRVWNCIESKDCDVFQINKTNPAQVEEQHLYLCRHLFCISSVQQDLSNFTVLGIFFAGLSSAVAGSDTFSNDLNEFSYWHETCYWRRFMS